MPTLLTRRDKKEIIYLKSLDSSTPYIVQQRKDLLDAIKKGEAERTGTGILKICTNQYNEQGRIIKRRKIGLLQREKGTLKTGDIFYFNRGFKRNSLFYQIESLFSLKNATREYAYLEKHHQ